MNRNYRLTNSIDFKRVRRTGKSYAHPFVVLIKERNQLARTRVGVSTGRSIGGAVSRNRAKRRLREIMRKYIHQLEPGWDLIILARKPLLDADWDTLNQAVVDLLQRAGIVTNKS